MNRFFDLSPQRVALFSYFFLIAAGTALLSLPACVTRPITLMDAFFTSTSAVAVTGLIVLDTPKDFTPFGQGVILALIQMGGLGYMTISTFLLITLRRKMGHKDRLVLAESLNYPGLHGLTRFLIKVVAFVALAEILGAVALTLAFATRQRLPEAILSGVFHSISAFNNAGFSTYSDNLMSFRGDPAINIIISLLIILGGIGYYVVDDIHMVSTGAATRLAAHTKIALASTLFLIVAGALGVLILEYGHVKGLWGLPLWERAWASFFTSVSARTAGFNTIDFSALSESTLFFVMILMFIGASPGGTGGGIKTVTAAVIALHVYNFVRGRREVVVFKRSVREEAMRRAMVILTLSFGITTAFALVLSRLESVPVGVALFEVISAFSTVGLSVGDGGVLSLSAKFSDIGKLMIILSMIIGRVGVLSFAIAMLGKSRESNLKHPEATLLL
ncbi:MAG: potassium transporter [Nitrospinae bacterium]|nr:potassium transporter [Nitrospinota bacterium]